MRPRPGLATLLLLLMLTGPGAAQAPVRSSDSTGLGAKRCFEAAPLLRCTTFWLTEFGMSAQVFRRSTEYYSGSSALVTWELGGMRNVRPAIAVGAAAFWELTSDAGILGVRPRLRYWLDDVSSLDIALGLVLLKHRRRTLGVSAQVAANLTPSLAFTTTLQSVRGDSRYDRPSTQLFAGARLGNKPGAMGGVLAPATVFLLALFFCSQTCD